MLQASFETSKSNVVKKVPVDDDFEDDENFDSEDTCANFADSRSSCGYGSKTMTGHAGIRTAPKMVSSSGVQKAQPSMSIHAGDVRKAPSLSSVSSGTSRLQKNTVMSKVVLNLEEDED